MKFQAYTVRRFSTVRSAFGRGAIAARVLRAGAQHNGCTCPCPKMTCADWNGAAGGLIGEETQ
jgi:hypothetical protein